MTFLTNRDAVQQISRTPFSAAAHDRPQYPYEGLCLPVTVLYQSCLAEAGADDVDNDSSLRSGGDGGQMSNGEDLNEFRQVISEPGLVNKV